MAASLFLRPASSKSRHQGNDGDLLQLFIAIRYRTKGRSLSPHGRRYVSWTKTSIAEEFEFSAR